MEHFIFENLSTYGPIAVFLLLMLSGFGIALCEEMVTLPAGMLIGTGGMDFWITAACAYVGIVSADFLWFALCRYYGTPLLHKRWFKRLVHPRRLLEGKHQLERRGAWLIVMARFIPSSRTSAITVAGTLHMPFWKFALATTSCVLITVPLQLGLGYLVGKGLGTESMADLLLKMLGLIVLVIAVSIGIAWWTGYRATRRRLPRAKASWLRRFRPRVRRKTTMAVVGNSSAAQDDAAARAEPEGAASPSQSRPPGAASPVVDPEQEEAAV